MIKITNTDVWGFNGAIGGMRNPYMSHEKSDSNYMNHMKNDESECLFYEKGWCDDCTDCCYCHYFGIGSNDMTLCKKLIKAGSEHRKFLRMIHVQADILAPRYWWAEMDTYKYVSMNSSSTMHLITKRELTIENFSFNEYVPSTTAERIVEKLNTWIKDYNYMKDSFVAEERELLFSAIKQILPESYNQLRTIDTNYECLLNIYRQRKNHRLTEWHDFRYWITKLPYMEEFLLA